MLQPARGVVKPGQSYRLSAFSKVNPADCFRSTAVADHDGKLYLEQRFATPGEYLLDVGWDDDAAPPLVTACLFALPEELARLRPYRGDLHIHTCFSDGAAPPLAMAVTGRKLGLDYLAITDHNRLQPSLDVIAQMAGIGMDLLALPGEEVSLEGSHVVAINTRQAVYEQMQEPRLAAKLAAGTLPVGAVAGLQAPGYTRTKWVIEEIRRQGGLSILAHPYWVAGRRFHLHRPLYEQLLRERCFDAVELLGDVDFEGNVLSIARYADELARGWQMPIVADSDTHRMEHTFGRYWTTVFAEACTVDGVLDAIRSRRAVACERHPGEPLRVFGPFALVEYALFLYREFFPLHDALCDEEGNLALRKITGEPGLEGKLADVRTRLRELYRHAWAGEEPRALTDFVQEPLVSRLQPSAGRLDGLRCPADRTTLRLAPRKFAAPFCKLHAEFGARAPEDVLLYLSCRIECPEAMQLAACLGYDGPVKLWVDGQELFHDPAGTNPACVDAARIAFKAEPGEHEVLVALGSNQGKAWGLFLRFERLDVPASRIVRGPTAYVLPRIPPAG